MLCVNTLYAMYCYAMYCYAICIAIYYNLKVQKGFWKNQPTRLQLSKLLTCRELNCLHLMISCQTSNTTQFLSQSCLGSLKNNFLLTFFCSNSLRVKVIAINKLETFVLKESATVSILYKTAYLVTPSPVSCSALQSRREMYAGESIEIQSQRSWEISGVNPLPFYVKYFLPV